MFFTKQSFAKGWFHFLQRFYFAKKVRKFSHKAKFDFVDTSLCYAKFSMAMPNKYSVMLSMISQYDKIYKHEKGFVGMTEFGLLLEFLWQSLFFNYGLPRCFFVKMACDDEQ